MTLEPAPERFDYLFAEMTAESDRGCILIGASAVDDVLQTALRALLSKDHHIAKHAVEPMFAAMGPLSTFSARIKLAYAVGLTPRWMFEDLEKIRKVRNKAAQEFSAKTFESPDVIQLVQLLKGADFAISEITPDQSKQIPQRAVATTETPKRRISKEYLRFAITVCYIAGFLDGSIAAHSPSTA
jgi:DNA-binding MltR family transcriptional regulator